MTANICDQICLRAEIDENNAKFPLYQKNFSYKANLGKRQRLAKNDEKFSPILDSVVGFGTLLGPQSAENKGKKTLVLDLDETLVHSSLTYFSSCTFIASITLEQIEYKIYVGVRPYAKEIIEALSNSYEIVIFTASIRQYAETIINFIDPNHKTARLYRESCIKKNAHFIKDLSKLGRNLDQTIIVDNSPECIELQPENGIIISSWTNSKTDVELLQLYELLLSDSFLNSNNICETIKTIGCA